VLARPAVGPVQVAERRCATTWRRIATELGRLHAVTLQGSASREDDEKQFERDGRTARSRAFVEQSLVPELRFWGIFSRVRSLGSKSVGLRDLGRIDGRFRRPPAGTDADVLARWQDEVLELLTAAVARGWIEMATLTNRKGNFDVAVTVTDFPDRPPAS
jgi:hypothetical protein